MSSIARVIFLVDCTLLMRLRRMRSWPPGIARSALALDFFLGQRDVTVDEALAGRTLMLGRRLGAVGRRGLELRGEGFEPRLEGVEVGEVARLGDAVEQIAMTGAEPFDQFVFEPANVVDRDRIEVAVGAGVDRHD